MREHMRSWICWSAWLCLSLMLWTAAAESTHNHPNPTDASSCSICVVAHSTSPTVSSAHGCRFLPRSACCKKSCHRQCRLDVSRAWHSRPSCPVRDSHMIRRSGSFCRRPHSLFVIHLRRTYAYFYASGASLPFFAAIFLLPPASYAQSGGNSGSISGTVVDPTGAVVPKQPSKFTTRSAILTDPPPPTMRAISVPERSV